MFYEGTVPTVQSLSTALSSRSTRSVSMMTFVSDDGHSLQTVLVSAPETVLVSGPGGSDASGATGQETDV